MVAGLDETYRSDIEALNRFSKHPGALLRQTCDGFFTVHRGYRRPQDKDRSEIFYALAAGFGGRNRADEFFSGRFSHTEMTLVCDWLKEVFRLDRERCAG